MPELLVSTVPREPTVATVTAAAPEVPDVDDPFAPVVEVVAVPPPELHAAAATSTMPRAPPTSQRGDLGRGLVPFRLLIA